MSTREAARAPGWQAGNAPPHRPQSHADRGACTAPRDTSVPPGTEEPPHDPRASIKASLDFNGLGLAPRPPARPSAALPKPGISCNGSALASKPGAHQARTSTRDRMGQTRDHGTAHAAGSQVSPSSPLPPKRVITHAPVTSAKGRGKGDGARRTAMHITAGR